MPLIKMEPAVVEKRDKVMKKKKKAEAEVKDNMKITDHFKTPEKDVQLVSKQKSLLHFFAKSPAAVINKSDVKDNSISDKENSGSKKSIVFPKWTSEDTNAKKAYSRQESQDCDENKKQNCIEILDDSVDGKDVVMDEIMQKEDKEDSVVMLSDLSDHTESKVKTETGKSEGNELGKKKNDKSKRPNKKCNKKDKKSENKTDDVKCETKSANETNHLDADTCRKDTVENKKDDDMAICEKDEKVKKTESLEEKKVVIKDKAENQEEVDTSTSVMDATDIKRPALKKNALKGSEMMNLLKEIKSSEKKEKKKKHKHKDKHKAPMEITDSEFVEKEEQNDDHKSDFVTIPSRESQREGRQKRTAIVSETDKQEKTTLKANSKLNKNDTVETEPTTEGKEKDTSASVEDKPKNQHTQGESEESDKVKEMSYADYLKSLENKNDEETNEQEDACSEAETFTKIVDSREHKNNTSESNESMEVQTTAAESTKGEHSGNTSGIARFFNIKTSTPNKQKENISKLNSPKVTKQSKGKKINSEGNEKVAKESSKKKKLNKKEKEESENEPEISIIEEASSLQKSSFLKSSDKTVFPEKTKQAVLSFGSAGLTMSKQTTDKPAAETEKDQDVCDKPKPKPGKRGKPGRPKKIVPEVSKTDVLDTSESVFETPRRGRKRKKREVKNDTTDLEDSAMSTDAEEGCNRRSSRKKYKVTAFQMDFYEKTPIKLRLKRCKKSSSTSGDEELAQLKAMQHQIKMKLTKAQLLLEKARKNKNKSKLKISKPNREDKPVKKQKKEKAKSEKLAEDSRRSSRLSGKCLPSMEEVSLDNIVISSDDESPAKGEPVVKKRGRPKGSLNVKSAATPKKDIQGKQEKTGTPSKKQTKTETPKKLAGTPKKNKSPKKAAKLHPMFMMGKKGPQPQASPVKPQLDPEQLRQRQEFLMSGVPDELKKQTATRLAAVVEADYPPIPEINHVQQIPSDSSSVWSLSKVDLKLRPFILSDPPPPVAKLDGCLAKSSANLDLACIKKFESHAKIEELQLDDCLGEIASFNPSYPVQKVYKSLKQNLPTLASALNTEEDQPGKSEGEVIVIDDKAVQPKKRARRSLKLKKKDEEEEEKLPEPEPNKPDVTGKGPCLLWTDKYYPSSTSEVLGNGSILKKLKNWLSEWKHMLDREARKARKLLMKKNKGKLPAKTGTTDDDDQWDDDSDFDLDSEDSEDDTSLCNTMMLVGPSGCGKTCCVYALAQELGFKVHEVNASASRSGRHILSQLQEATQSHQVARQGCNTPSKKPAPVAVEKPVNPKMSAAFSNFFKKTADPKPDNKGKDKKRKRNVSGKDTSPEKKRRKKEELKKPTVIDESSQAVNLTSTTLILFDEVDVFFEEDRGFLSAIQTFMSTTKIPILLTTSDPGFTSSFDGRYEQLNLRPPPVRSVVSRLQTIALLENVRTDVGSLSELVQCYRGDVRKCVVSLQYVLGSGGSHIQNYSVPQKPGAGGKTLPAIAEDSQDCSQGDFSSQGSQPVVRSASRDGMFDEDDEDFVLARPAAAKKKRILEDDSSVSGEMFAEMFLQKQGKPGSTSAENDAEARKYPPVHAVGLEACLGIGRENGMELQESLIKYLKGNCTSSAHLLDICGTLRRSLNSDIIHSNLPVILPLVVKVVDCVARVTEKKEAVPKRKRIQNDLYDSEASNDGTDDDKADEPEEKPSQTYNKDENICLAKTLSSFACFYDTMSSMDILETKESCMMDNLQTLGSRELRGRLVSGMGTSYARHPPGTSEDLEAVRGYRTEVEAGAAARMYREVEAVQNRVEQLCDSNPAFSEEFVLPVMKGSERFRLSASDRDSSKGSEVKRACDNVLDNLPLVTHKHRRNLHTDYLPTLREMCRFEQCRQLTNTKRRFQHYFDSVNFSVRDRTLGVLATTFL